MLDLLIISVPYLYSYGPALAPALLKSCAERDGLTAIAWDYAAEFNFHNETHINFIEIKSWTEINEYKLSPSQFDWYTDQINECVKKIKLKNPRYVALSLMTLNSCRFAEDLCFYIKTLLPDVKIITGGSGQDVFLFQYQKKWNQLMIDSGLIDCSVIGEGEFALSYVIKNNVTGIYTVNQLRELVDIPVPDYSDYDFSIYKNSNQFSYWNSDFSLGSDSRNNIIFSITASKGCVKNCNFCDVGKIWPKFRFRPGKQVANEIIELHQKYHANFFSFTDSLINGGLKPFKELNQELALRLPNTIKYEAQFIARSQRDMPEHYFEMMAAAGCHLVSVGVESGSEAVRMHMGKGSSQEDISYTSKMLTKYKILQFWNIIVGYPTETDIEWNETMQLVEYWLHHSNGLLRVIPTETFMLLNGTPITSDQSINELKIENETISGYSEFNWVSGINPSNTFEIRATRFLDLCKFLIQFDPHYEIVLQQKIKTVTRRLNLFNSNEKRKKIFIINNN